MLLKFLFYTKIITLVNTNKYIYSHNPQIRWQLFVHIKLLPPFQRLNQIPDISTGGHQVSQIQGQRAMLADVIVEWCF